MLALHGFTLGGAMFAELAGLLDGDVIAPDLPGHGGRDATNTSWHDAVGEVVELVLQLQPGVVLGYSMGGRLALAAALAAPQLFRRLVLVSTSRGIADAADRHRRQADDEAAAAAIEAARSADDFLERFEQTPFLQAPGTTLDLAAIRRANSYEGIVGALRGMGQGSQPYVGGDLADLPVPIVWVAGSQDDRYAAIATNAAAMSPSSRVEIFDAAHNVIAQQPAAVAAVVAAN